MAEHPHGAPEEACAARTEAVELFANLAAWEFDFARLMPDLDGLPPEEAARERERRERMELRISDMNNAIHSTKRDYILLRCLRMAKDMYEEEGDPEESGKVADVLARAESALGGWAEWQAGRDKREASTAFGQPGAMERLKAFYESDPRARGKRGKPTNEALGELMGVSDVTAGRYIKGECEVSRCAAANLMLSIGQKDYMDIITGNPVERAADTLRAQCAGELDRIEDVGTLGVVRVMLRALADDENPPV